MPGYLNQAGNSIGSLLRFIQEQKSQSPIVPPKSESGSPIRNVVQQPLSGEEGKGTSKVVSIRPEGTLTPSGQPIEQGTPQSSRIGPISIGGADIGPVGKVGPEGEAPVSVVAANEPGKGFSIPSATRTTGDVLNKTGAASGQPPGLGTNIKAAVPQTTRGQSVIDYSFTRNKQQADVTDQAVKDAIARNERSTAETLANSSELENQYNQFMGGINEDISSVQRDRAILAYAKNPTPENRAAYLSAIAPPTPKPVAVSPQGDIGDSGISQVASPSSSPNQNQESSSGGGQVKGVSTINKPGLTYMTPPKQKVTFSPQPSVNIPKAVSSGGLTVQKPVSQAKAPSIGTSILQSLKNIFGFK